MSVLCEYIMPSEFFLDAVYIEALSNRQNFTLYFICALEITVNLVSLKVL